MKSLNQEAIKIFEEIKDKTKGKLYLQAGVCFDPLAFQEIFPPSNKLPSFMENAKFYAISHFYVLNGDLMREPEYCICECEIKGVKNYIPYLYRQDSMGIYQESVLFDENRIYTKLQESHKDGANFFLRGVKLNGYLNAEAVKYDELSVKRYER